MMDTKEIIAQCDEWEKLANTPEMVDFVKAIRAKLEAEQGMAEVLKGPNYTYHSISEMYCLDKKGRKRQEEALAKWEES